MPRIIIFIIAICLLLFESCYKETEIEIPYSGDKMVAYSFLYTDQPIEVILSKSRPLDSSLMTYITNATIKFYENNSYIEDLICDIIPYISPSNYMCKAGSEYTMYIYNEGLGASEASVAIPDPVSIRVVDTSSMTKRYTWRSIGQEGEEIYFLSGLRSVLCTKIEINDPPGEKNYYILDIDMPPVEIEFPEPGIYSFPVSYDSEEKMIDGWIGNINIPSFTANVLSVYFSDKLFNGGSYIFTIFILKKDNAAFPLGRIYIKMYSISEGYYNYIKSVQEWEKNHDNPFAEPVIIYSNIANGMGILGGASCYTDSTVVINE